MNDQPTKRSRYLDESLLLHLRARQVPERAIRITHTFGLGGVALVLVLLLMVTGLTLGLFYDPAPERAYQSILILQEGFLFGRLLRGVHFWSANLLVIVVGLHLGRVFLTGAFRGERRSNWLIGVGLLFGVLLSAFTGYLLPWDQLSFWAVTVCSEMLSYVPGIGEGLRRAVLGGDEVGASTLVLFYAVHSSILPLSFVLLLTWHFWRVRLAGGVILPPARDGQSAGRWVPFIPDLLVRELVVAQVVVAMVLVAAVLAGAPLGDPANVGLSPNPAKAPWYFVGLQELLMHFHPLFAVVIIPVLLASALLAAPWLPGEGQGGGEWFLSAKGRRLAAGSALLGAFLTTAGILCSEFLVGPQGLWPQAGPVVGQGLLPFLAVAVILIGIHRVCRGPLGATKDEALQTIFVFLITAFVVLTVTGTWFRGEGMTLAWPWQA